MMSRCHVATSPVPRLAVPLAVLLLSSVASAQQRGAAASVSTETCLSTNDKAQSLRTEKRLREAREQLKICSQPSCPSAVQKDCSQWLREVEAALPTLSFSAKGAEGDDLTDVKVSVDGNPLLEELDGSAVPVDPGKHSFRFDHEGEASVTQEILVNEGDKARRVEVRFGKSETAPRNTSSGRQESGSRYSPYPFILGGVGAAAMIGGFAFMANRNTQIPDNCKRVSGRCDDVDKDDPILQEAASLKNQSYIGLGIGVGGAAVLAGGIVWFLVESVAPAKSKKPVDTRGTLRLQPALGFGYAGLSGSF